jgi:DNA-binding MarR family transcriptional regulator
LKSPAEDTDTPLAFAFFREIGILSQLSSAMLAAVLPDGIHPSHFGVVSHLNAKGRPQTPVQIASAMQVTKNTMTHTLRVLSSHGLIDVEPNPEDARGKLVRLTPAGQDFLTRAQRAVVGRFQALFGAEHYAIMHDTLEDLHRLRTHLDDNR